MTQRVRFFKGQTVTGGTGRPETARVCVWTPWAEIYTQTSSRKPAGLDVLQEGELAFEVRRCDAAERIRRDLFSHAATYEVELEGDTYTITSAGYTRNDRAKIAFRASSAV